MIKSAGTFSGLILGLISIFGAFLIEGGSAKALFLLPALIIVFGGTFSATIIGFGLEKFISIFRLIKIAYFPRHYNLKRLINLFVGFSAKSKRSGILTIERDIEIIDHPFPKKLVKYVIDGTNAESLRNLADLELKGMQERHYSNILIFNKMGGYAPTMGIIGTVMGLIMTLANAGNDPNLLIKNIATAFIATLWGIFSANIIWLPISDKLKKCHLEEKLMMEISVEGTLALQSQETPSIVKARLASMLPQKEQEKIHG
ncbi:MAG TPA: MotA/TolQ/ExbB proton channel family protein [Ignavibacteriaceae bacterium]|nr:MotA/TolQ/ExbB proton channel family protein [Ignavibacteriaceae bacterium]